ncbi:MAG: hypothetical protein QXU98_10745 [Candidatus Parvarchaeota archaeon]
MFGLDTTIDYDSTPWAVFTTPQVAGVGMTEIDFYVKVAPSFPERSNWKI